MTEKQFLQILQKYGKEKVYFSSLYKYRAVYENEKLRIRCSGVVQSRDDLRFEETVFSIFDLEDFQFGFIPEPDKTIE